MIVVYGEDAFVAEWAGGHLGKPFDPPFTAIGFSKDGATLSGAAVFNGWNGSNIDVTIYGPGCLSRESIRAVYEYVFGQIGAQRLTARTKRSNKRMQRLLPRLGFVHECVARRWYGPERANDAIVAALFREAALRWLQRLPKEAAAHV